MPLPIIVAHKIMKKYEEFRRKRSDFFSDAKSQVSVEYEGNTPRKITTVLVSVSHAKSLTLNEIQTIIQENVINEVMKEYKSFARKTNYIVNPSGKFTIWGAQGDSGCVGRKIVVDTYGGVGRVGGGCFSSKNATKVDRSGAYYARYVAKTLLPTALQTNVKFKLPMELDFQNQLQLTLKLLAQRKNLLNKFISMLKKTSISALQI